MNIEFMKKLLDSLVAIKASRHDVAETSVDEKLDDAIKVVEKCIKSERDSKVTTDEVLIAIGRILEKLPSIIALLKLFSD